MSPLTAQVFVGSTTQALSDAAAHTLFERVREANLARGLTGCLLYNGGNFIEWLEGPADVVEAVLNALSNNLVCQQIVRIDTVQLDARVFDTWSAWTPNDVLPDWLMEAPGQPDELAVLRSFWRGLKPY